jgi:Na+/H+ antiporter NhaD/arsenite permease-like protein
MMHRGRKLERRSRLAVSQILRRVDTPTILFFLGILCAVSALESAGHLALLSGFLDRAIGNVYGINLAIGAISAIVDNVPLVASAMGMYPVHSPESIAALADPAAAAYLSNFTVDGIFWEFLAYCAGTGGSMLVIGSAAGVAAMGLAKIDFIWYLKRISPLALLGYLAGALAYYLQVRIFG